MSKKQLSSAQGVEAATILFECNTIPTQVDALATASGIVPEDADASKLMKFRLQWYGYVHAAVVAGLMVHAPNIVMATYLRSTTYLLKKLNISDTVCATFVDTYFSPYMELLLHERQKECPALFFRRYAGVENLDSAPQHGVAMLAGAMAMTLGAIHDKLDNYDIQPE